MKDAKWREEWEEKNYLVTLKIMKAQSTTRAWLIEFFNNFLMFLWSNYRSNNERPTLSLPISSSLSRIERVGDIYIFYSIIDSFSRLHKIARISTFFFLIVQLGILDKFMWDMRWNKISNWRNFHKTQVEETFRTFNLPRQ